MMKDLRRCGAITGLSYLLHPRLCCWRRMFGARITALSWTAWHPRTRQRAVRLAMLLRRKDRTRLEAIFERMNPVDRTPNPWAQNAARAIVHHAARPGAEEERARAEAALVRILQFSAHSETISFAIRLVSRIGTEISVPALAKLLDKPENREMALYGLECNPSECVTPYLLNVCQNAAEDTWKAALVQTLGMRGDMDARKTVLEAMESRSADVRLAAIAAAGNLPHRTAIKALWKIWNENEGIERQAAAEALLAAADKELEDGGGRSAAKICLTLYKESKVPEWRAAGLAGFARANQRKALPLLREALRDADPILRGVAQRALVEMPDSGRAAGILKDALHSPEPLDRTGAIRVLALRPELVDKASLEAIIKTLLEAEGEPQEAASFALTSIPGGDVTQTIARARRQRQRITEGNGAPRPHLGRAGRPPSSAGAVRCREELKHRSAQGSGTGSRSLSGSGLHRDLDGNSGIEER